MQYRPFGNTGIDLSFIGFGGILVAWRDDKKFNADLVAEAVDRGINYFDVAPQYGDAQENMGPALQPYRKDAFLACKSLCRDAAGVREELEDSLRKLKTDHFDLYQLHAMTTEEDLNQVLAPGGALEAFVQARQEGKIRFIGFSAHSSEIAIRLMEAFDFNSILFPVNWVTWLKEDFGPAVVKKAEEKGVARLALKALARRSVAEGEEKPYERCWYVPEDNSEIASLALRFTLSQNITAAIPPGDERLFRMALDFSEDFTPITEAEVDRLSGLARENAAIFQLNH